MANTFTLFDIPALMTSFGCSTIAHDCLLSFLNSYTWDDVYETEDESLVFESGDDISLEFLHYGHPLKRKVSIMYKENNDFVILSYEDLMKIA